MSNLNEVRIRELLNNLSDVSSVLWDDETTIADWSGVCANPEYANAVGSWVKELKTLVLPE